jgi:GMP synthase (glutamine-hydrolysing)
VTRALVLVHDKVPGRGVEEIGTVGPALRRLGFEMVVGTFVAGGTPMPPLHRIALVVVLGSEAAAYDDTLPWLAPELAYLREAVDAGTPVLGICFGAQALAAALGGSVHRLAKPEIGWVTVDSADAERLPSGPWMAWHEDGFTLPPLAYELASNEFGVQAFCHCRHLAVQFHPEVTPAIVDAWAEQDQANLERAGVDPAELDATPHAVVAARAAERLFDGFAARAGLVAIASRT